jgi:putative FmdB family regulatory protein
MPIYEYRCSECGAAFEKFLRSIQSAVEIECPQCHSKQCQKSISRLGAVSVGGGGSLASSASCAPSGG